VGFIPQVVADGSADANQRQHEIEDAFHFEKVDG
jgi:hypothetical protein